ncbi:MAG: PLP-dependent transferase [Bacteroidales bacterium]|nr:PLP-dependent transferase [Bacteroidales bacterium]MBN2634379.1 PLP-dependent transferase [Bacteroidales bacterium]
MKKKAINTSRTPVYRDAGFDLYNAEMASEAFSRENDPEREPDLYIYSRYRNPTVVAAEEEIMKLEESEWALLTQSGMSAIDTAVSIFHRGRETRPWLFFSEIYGGTITFAETILKQHRGLDIHSFSPKDEKYDLLSFESIVKSLQPEFVYIEAISNPMLIVPDVRTIIGIARKYGSKIIADNTFATPLLWKPLNDGADLVIHSATKYFSGHGNITAGVICGNDNYLMKAALNYRKYTGHMISADDAYRLHDQIQTLELRFNRQCINASMIASLLAGSEKIGKVWYPELAKHPTHNEASMLFGDKGFGGMVTFDFAGDTPEQKRSGRDQFIRLVEGKIRLIPSLGDPKTIILPVESVWGVKYPEPGMLRLSAGFENTGDLKDTIVSALNSIV